MKSPPLYISVPVNSVMTALTRRVLLSWGRVDPAGRGSVCSCGECPHASCESLQEESRRMRDEEHRGQPTRSVRDAIVVECRRRYLRFNLFIINNIPATWAYISTQNTGIRHHFEEQSHRSVSLTIEEMWTGRQSHGRNHRYLYALAMNPHVDY